MVVTALWTLVAPAALAEAVQITDDTGASIRVDKPAARIIALYGAYNEILGALGIESRIVARTKADQLPPSIRTKPSIGTHMRPNVEMVLALRPDLVIQGGGRREAMAPVSQLRDQGVPVAVFSPTSFEQLFTVVHRIGILTGTQDTAAALIREMKARLDAVTAAVSGANRKPRVFFEVRYPNLLGAGRNSLVDDVIKHAGGVNCVTADKKLVRIDMESLILWRPDAYVVQRGSMNQDPAEPAQRPNFQVVEAVKNGRVLFVDEQVFSRPGPRLVDAVETLAAFLNPGHLPAKRRNLSGR